MYLHSLQKKRIESKYDESRGVHAIDEGPLDDPIAEKLRQQRLVEEADYAATMELFGKRTYQLKYHCYHRQCPPGRCLYRNGDHSNSTYTESRCIFF